MRLGELLIREGVITIDQLEGALELHRRQGQRIGSSLVELGYADVDTIARALSAQLRVPAALAKHVADIDPQVVAVLPARVASTYRALPLGYTQTRPPRLVVAFRDPRTTPIEEVAFAAGTPIDPAVAPEILIERSLERYYGITRNREYVALETPIIAIPVARPSRPRPPPVDAPEPDEEETSPGTSFERAPADETADDTADDPDTIQSTFDGTFDATRPFLGTQDAIDALRVARSRDEIGDTIVAWLRLVYGCGLVLIVKDGTALGWKGYAPEADPELIESISMPLGPPSMLTPAYEDKTAFRGAPPEEGMALQTRLWKLLRCKPPREVLVAPILLGNRVVNLIYAHAERGVLDPTALEDIAAVAAAAAEEYTRIIRTRHSRES